MSSEFPATVSVQPLVAISRCLLGERVRYDGGHKQADLLLELLGPRVRWLPCCPEVELGLPVPRPPLHLARNARDELQLLAVDGTDLSGELRAFARRRISELRAAGIEALITKSRSPCCGLATASVFGHTGGVSGIVERGAGYFIRELHAAWPELPIVEDTELCCRAACASFLHGLLGRRPPPLQRTPADA